MIGKFKKELPYKMNGQIKMRWADYVQEHTALEWAQADLAFGLLPDELFNQYKVARLLEQNHCLVDESKSTL